VGRSVASNTVSEVIPRMRRESTSRDLEIEAMSPGRERPAPTAATSVNSAGVVAPHVFSSHSLRHPELLDLQCAGAAASNGDLELIGDRRISAAGQPIEAHCRRQEQTAIRAEPAEQRARVGGRRSRSRA